MYYLLRQLSTRNITRGEVETIEEALAYLQKNSAHGRVQDMEGNIYNLEELEYAESIRPETGNWKHYFVSSEPEISEDSDRELSESDTDRTESSTECDN